MYGYDFDEIYQNIRKQTLHVKNSGFWPCSRLALRKSNTITNYFLGFYNKF